MTSEEKRELEQEIREEARIFKKAYDCVKKRWTKEYSAAVKSGDRDFPKFPSKPFIWVREAKYKSLTSDKAADAWFAKEKARVNAAKTAQAAANMRAIKAAQSSATAGYKGHDDKKERQNAAKQEMDDAVKEKLGEVIEEEMAKLLKFNRPVKRHFVYDTVAGADTNVQKLIDKQDEALKKYRERKAAAEVQTETAE